MTEQITSSANQTIKLIRQLGRDRACRKANGMMVCDGLKLLTEALDSGLIPVQVITPVGFSGLPAMPENVRCITVSSALYDSLSPLDTPQPVLFTLKIPGLSLKELPHGGQHIILDRVQDPGNVGSIIRTACALGIDTVVLTTGCAEFSNPKTLRGAMGTAFRQQVKQGTPEEILHCLQESGLRVYTTGMNREAIPLGQAALSDCAVLVGNEGQGVSDFWLSQGYAQLTIPMVGRCESLGVAAAAALIIGEMRRGC